MAATEKLTFAACAVILIVLSYRLTVRLYQLTRGFGCLPIQRSSLAQGLFDRPLANTLVIELVLLIAVAAILVSLLPPLPGPK